MDLLRGFAACLIQLILVLPGCSGQMIDEPGLVDRFEKIHRKIYDVYGLTDPDQVFDLLSASLKGEELERQVFEYLKCLKVQDRFNTRIFIADVVYNDVRVQRVFDAGAEIYCKWIVIGKVRHPTHIHRKTNLNEALYRVSDGPGGMRIVGYDLITQQALEVGKG